MHWLHEVGRRLALILTALLFVLAVAACPKNYPFNK